MAKRNSPSFVVILLLIGVGLAISIGTSIKAHEYYYPDDDFGQIVKEPTATFIVKRNGRYEISYEDKLGNLRFNVVNVETGAPVPVQEFDFPENIFGVEGWRGHWFRTESTGTYRLSTDPWPARTELVLQFRDTQAVHLWTLGGILVAAPFTGFGVLLLILRVLRPKKASSSGSLEEQDLSDN